LNQSGVYWYPWEIYFFPNESAKPSLLKAHGTVRVPRRDDIKKILLIGSGPIIIGQACEFDYSGTQACKALREEGYEVVLVNSNPATIMTDPEVPDARRTDVAQSCSSPS